MTDSKGRYDQEGAQNVELLKCLQDFTVRRHTIHRLSVPFSSTFPKNHGANSLLHPSTSAQSHCGGFPTLTGLSRKRFIGKLIQSNPPADQRDFGTAAAVSHQNEQNRPTPQYACIDQAKCVLKNRSNFPLLLPPHNTKIVYQVTLCIANGSDLVRYHHPSIADSISIADAILR